MLPAHTAEWSEVEWSGADEREFVYPQLNGIRNGMRTATLDIF